MILNCTKFCRLFDNRRYTMSTIKIDNNIFCRSNPTILQGRNVIIPITYNKFKKLKFLNFITENFT